MGAITTIFFLSKRVYAAEQGMVFGVFRDRGDHFKVVGLKNLASTRRHYIKVSVSPLKVHLRAILFTASKNVT